MKQSGFSEFMDKIGPEPELRVKKLVPEAVLPTKAHPEDTGYDCVALDDGTWGKNGTYIEYRTGLAVEPPYGYYTKLFSRSSISKYDLVLANSVGIVDQIYRGELLFRFKYVPRLTPTLLEISPGNKVYVLEAHNPILYKKGDKIGQIVIEKRYELSIVEVESLSSTDRGEGGFGSSDNHDRQKSTA